MGSVWSALKAIGGLLSTLFAWVPVVLGWLAGYRRAKQEMQEDSIDEAKQAAEIDENVDGMSSADLDEQLRKRRKR